MELTNNKAIAIYRTISDNFLYLNSRIDTYNMIIDSIINIAKDKTPGIKRLKLPASHVHIYLCFSKHHIWISYDYNTHPSWDAAAFRVNKLINKIAAETVSEVVYDLRRTIYTNYNNINYYTMSSSTGPWTISYT